LEVTGDIYSSTGAPAQPLGSFAWRVQDMNGLYYFGSTPYNAALGLIGTPAPAPYVTTGVESCPSVPTPELYQNVTCRILRNLVGNPDYSVTVSYRPVPAGATNSNPTTPSTVATDEEVATQVAPQLQPQALPKLHTDPVTGAVEENQAIVDKMTEIANEVAKLNDPANEPVTPPVATVSPTTSTPATGSDAPSFCIYASVVCDFIDWFKSDPEEPEGSNWTVAGMITEEEIEVQNYSSGLGGGSCPNPESFSVLGGTFEYSYQPICDLAGTARIFVLLFAYLSSIYILLGMKRS